MNKGKENPSTQARQEYYREFLDQYLSKFTVDFSELIGNETVVNLGDQLLAKRQSGGYNFATFEQFPLNSEESIIFYGMYSQRKAHLTELLRSMEEQKIIDERNVSLGIRATKLFGSWANKECKPGKIIMEDDKSEKYTRESVEAVMIFRLTSGLKTRERLLQAARIVSFLLGPARKIEGTYDTPDVRTTATDELKQVFTGSEEDMLRLVPAVANVLKFTKGNLIALRQETSLSTIRSEDWNSIDGLINEELFEYLTVEEVRP